MSPTELHALIDGDAQAKALAESGAADLCAARCREIAPKVVVERMVTELSFFKIYDIPSDAEAALQQIESVAGSNPVVARIRKWLQPGAVGVDIGDARVRQMLTLPVTDGGVGLSASLAAPLLRSAEVAPNITGADVSTAWPFGV